MTWPKPQTDIRMDEHQFWSILEDAWSSDSGLVAFREDVLATIDSKSGKEEFEEKYDDEPMIPNEEALLDSIRGKLSGLTKDELHQFDVILERKLYEIDRQEIQEHTDGSDDGFLYCRGFIVAIGKEYYEAVNRAPNNAMYDWECESITYISYHMYTEKFGDMPSSGISRESCSNANGWPN